MCWPGLHSQNCEERGKYFVPEECIADGHFNRSSDKLQSAIYYAMDGDEVRNCYPFSAAIMKQIFA